MSDEITTAIKRKEYGWFFLYIFIILLGTRLAGIGGIVGASMMAFGLYRTNKNSSYSVLKKIFLSVAYVVGGVVVAFIIAALLSWLVLSFSRQQPATTQSVEVNQPTLNDGLPTSAVPTTSTPLFMPSKPPKPTNTLPVIASPKSNTMVQLAAMPYINQKYGFQITPPKDWVLDESGDADTIAYFLNGIEDKEDSYRWQASINLGVKPGNQGFSLDEYMTAYKNQMKQWFASYLVEEEEKKSINGHDADIISGTFDRDGHKFRNLQLFMVEKGNAYSVSAVVLESTWGQYKDVLSASVESFALLSN